ncbi:MAG: hypothetical protein N2D54_03725 [Chloroflexota bacterium]
MTILSVSDVKVFVPTKNFNQSIKFYSKLGWDVIFQSDDLAEMELADNRIYLQNFYQKGWANNFMLFMDVADAQSWYDHIYYIIKMGKFGSARVNPPKKQDYGALVTFAWDPCGVLLHFAQALPGEGSPPKIMVDTKDE